MSEILSEVASPNFITMVYMYVLIDYCQHFYRHGLVIKIRWAIKGTAQQG